MLRSSEPPCGGATLSEETSLRVSYGNASGERSRTLGDASRYPTGSRTYFYPLRVYHVL
ncbi:hypothetical protein ACF3DV_32395 [Chlorogloeopsis fritschii PCC 9212]|uniref:hypothetical protein n=1 Tax=Chlorogloeopsis fritschii TaxID=1124 RepID=UPI00138AF4A7|nr:hypothetical protein [Chlorogloeopsis fritschii]MBF2007725.1 hypothetical protein [Chlorogloeopsis fritschii C42_A2020_084]